MSGTPTKYIGILSALIWVGMLSFATADEAAPANASTQTCEEETVRLDASGGTVASAEMQDQDGLGVCYANTASLMLQSVIPGHPAVSYLDLAIGTSASGVSGTAFVKSAKEKDKSLYFEGGFVCDAIQAAQKKGRICSRKSVSIERLGYVYSPLLQKKGTDALGEWADALASIRGQFFPPGSAEKEASVKQWAQVKQSFKKLTDYIESEAQKRLSKVSGVQTDEVIGAAYLEAAEKLFSKKFWLLGPKKYESVLTEQDVCYLDPILKSFEEISKQGGIGHGQAMAILVQMRESIDLSPQEFFERAFAPTCEKDALKIPEGTTCMDYFVPKSFLGKDKSSSAEEFRLVKDAYRDQALGQLRKGKAVGISLCSAALADFSYDRFEHIESGAEGSRSGCSSAYYPAHGAHAVTMIGYRKSRAADGSCKTEYLIQNSWGKDWCREKGALCDGGKLWIPDDTLAKNTFDLSVLHQQQKAGP